MSEPGVAVSVCNAEQVALLTVEEVAEYLRVHPQTVRDYIRTGDLPAVDLSKVGAKHRTLRVDEAELRAWVERRRHRPEDDDDLEDDE